MTWIPKAITRMVVGFLANRVIQEEGDRKQAELKLQVAARGPGWVREKIGKFQTALKARILNLPLLPEAWKKRLEHAVEGPIKEALRKFEERLAAGSADAAIDYAFDGLQAALKGQLELALKGI